MNLLSEGWLALQQNAAAVVVFAVLLLWGCIVIAATLRPAVRLGCDASDCLSIVLGGWILPVLLLSVVVLSAGIFLRAQTSMALAAALLAATAAGAVWRGRRVLASLSRVSAAVPLSLGAIPLALLVVRLGFIVRLALPLYFDSAEHYRIISVLIGDYAGAGALVHPAWPTPTYYHLGFHIMLAAMAATSTATPVQLMLVSGQFVLAVLPFSLYLIAHHETRSAPAGIFAVILGAFGWTMPAFAVNWGKYPALFSLPIIVFTLNMAYLAGQSARQGIASRLLIALTVLGACAAALIHTRSIIILGIAVGAWTAAGWWVARARLQRLVWLAVTLAVLMTVAVLISRNTVLGTTLDPYVRAGLAVTVLVGLLCVPAFVKHPRLAYCCLLTALLLLVALFVPGPAFASSTLLDRPLVEMVMFIPLSMLGAAGFDGLLESFPARARLAPLAGLLVVTLVIVLAGSSLSTLHPSTCCSLIQADDLVALDWLERSLPADARVLIPSAQLSFSPGPYPVMSPASDAGVWIKPLTTRETSPLPFGIDFRLASTRQLICARGIAAIFVGSGAQSFDHTMLDVRPDWYEGLLILPGARVYRPLACPP